MQIRNNADWDEYGWNVNLEKFYDEIDKFPDNTKFYLSAMNIVTAKLIKQKYGNRIIELPNKDYTSMSDAVADLYIMSKAKIAIYSYNSTFAELAWWFSGAKQDVIIVGKKD